MYFNICLLYTTGLYLTFAFDELSFNAVASQSPIYPSQSSNQLYVASNAIDRNTATCMRTDAIGPNAPNKHMWWKVDLGEVYNIYSVNILFKNYDGEEYRQRGRFAGFSLYVSNNGDIHGSTLCYKDGPQLPPLNFTTVCSEYGRFVIFFNERNDGVVYPDEYQLLALYTELCEVIVKGCKHTGVYGRSCDIPCPDACKGSTCHILSGACLECEHGVYGIYCNLSCPTNCKDNTCQMLNGTCFTCKPGWIGMYCKTKCKEGWYGTNCSQQCLGHCRDNTPCTHVTGQCDKGCDAGWTESLCEKGCDDGTFGYNCVNNCSGHCLNDSPCNKQTGHCDRGCEPGYTNNGCSKECSPGHFGVACIELCSGHCENNEPCDHVSGLCSNGCQDGYIGTHCNNSCEAGTYGKNCAFKCSQNCIGICGHIDGSCTVCKNGWKGYSCNEACLQSYGENCVYPCSPHCYNQTCDRFNGRCLYCCTDGFHGELCNERNKLLKQNESSANSWSIVLIISLVINFVLIGCGCLLCSGIYTRKVSISKDFLLFSKKSIYYTDADVKDGENSTYQELDLSREEIQYQNTTIQ